MLFRCTIVVLAMVEIVHPQKKDKRWTSLPLTYEILTPTPEYHQVYVDVGDVCVERHSNMMGRCTPAAQCVTAENDYRQNGIAPTFCSRAYGNPIICCRDGTNILQTRPPKTTATPPSDNGYGDRKRLSERKCEEYSSAVTQTVDYLAPLPDPDTFTISGTKCEYTGTELIVGGQNTNPGEFPHMAAVGWIDFNGGYAFNCGGSLISSRFVLTAGHCTWDPRTKEPQPSIVRLGDQNIDPEVNDNANPIDVAIKSIHKHPEFKPPKRYNDIALLKLNTDVEFNTAIRPACLWNRFDFGEHTRAVATGWGINDTVLQLQVKELQKVSLTLLENNYCEPLLIVNRNWRGFTNSQMCAGELRGNKDTCQGDSGSPLQVSSKDNQCIFHVVGIVSFGKRCANGKPAIYTRVYSYLPWIESIVWPGES